MIPVIETSASSILRATHIFHLRVQASTAGEWEAAPIGGVMRSVSLELALVSVLKGKTQQKEGETLSLTITQYGTGMSRRFAVPGVWSPAPIEPQTELLAFCRGQIADAVELLAEPFCELVILAGDSLDDVQAAAEIENSKWTPAAIFSFIKGQAHNLGYIFAEYLWAKYADAAMQKMETFELLINLVEYPELNGILRSSLIDQIYGKLYGTAYATEEMTCRFAIALFRLLNVEAAKNLHDNIIAVFLPNLLGIKGGAERCHPEDTFAAAPEERSKAIQMLNRYEGAADKQPLQGWLK